MKRRIIAIITIVLAISAIVMVKQMNTVNDQIINKEEVESEAAKKARIKEEKINAIMAKMSQEEKVGQTFIVRMPVEEVSEQVKKYHFGGMVIFDANLEGETQDTLANKLATYQKDSKQPMLLGIDEEGGIVSRISYSKLVEKAFKSPQALYKQGKFEAIKNDAINKSKLLKKLNINLNLAPVVDVATDKDAFIYSRTIGLDEKKTSEYASVVVKAMASEKMGSTLKHFPGYGNNKDSHVEIVTDKRKLKNLRKVDFKPFEAGIKAGANSILVSHNIVRAIDKKVPASISPKVNQLIRKELKFDKVVMTDDLDMAGIADYTGQDQAAFQALKAGNDLVMTSQYQKQIPYIIKQIKNKKLSQSRIDQACKRVLSMKYDLGLIK